MANKSRCPWEPTGSHRKLTRQVTKQDPSDIRMFDELVYKPNACIVNDNYGVIAAVGYVPDHWLASISFFLHHNVDILGPTRTERLEAGELTAITIIIMGAWPIIALGGECIDQNNASVRCSIHLGFWVRQVPE